LYNTRSLLDVFDGSTGQLTLQIPLEQFIETHYNDLIGCQPSKYVVLAAGNTSPVIVDGNGNINLEYQTGNSTWVYTCDGQGITSQTIVINTNTVLLTVSPDGSISSQTLRSDTATTFNQWTPSQPQGTSSYSGSSNAPGRVIPDGQGGALATWSEAPNGTVTVSLPIMVTHLSSSGGGTYSLPLVDASRLVVGENGVAFATDARQKAMSFNTSSGQVLWTYQAPAQSIVSIVASAAGNGLVAKLTNQNGTDQVIRFNSNGTATTDTWSTRSLDYWAGNLWLGIPLFGSPTGYSATPVQFSASNWFAPDMSGTNQAVQNLYVTSPSSTGPNQALITSVFGKIKTALDADATSAHPTCSNWLQGGGLTGSSVIQTLLSANNFGHGVFSINSIAAFTYGTNPDKSPIGIPSNFAVTVNDNGSFFNAKDSSGRSFLVGKRNYSGSTLRAQATILIHETAHLVSASGFQSDFGIPKAGKSNDALVDTNCRSLIEGLQ